MGLVKTRRLAYPPLVGVRDPWGSEHAERSECRAMHKQQRAKAAMKQPMKGGAGKGGGAFWLRDGCTDKGK